jgi:hypothetical protein
MGKFRDFILKEEMGLGELGTRIDNLFHSHRFGNQIGGAFASSDVTGSEQSPTMGYAGHSLHLPSTDLTIPSVTKQGRITILRTQSNPIYVQLSDGTQAHFTYDEYKRIQGTPDIGKVMTLIFQRHPNDRMQEYSKIDQAIVND